MNNARFTLIHSLELVLAAFFWGTTFVAQSIGAQRVGAFTYLACRSYIGFVVLIPVVLFIRHLELKKPKEQRYNPNVKILTKGTVHGGIAAGSILVISSGLQQTAMATASTSKAGFLTAMYILGVPILGMIFLRKKVNIKVWIGVAIAVVGLYLLCLTDNSGLQKEDFLLILCAVMFACHILTIDHFTSVANCVAMSAGQFLVCGIWSTILMLLFENPQWSDISAAGFSIIYAGLFSSGVAYTLQIVGQKDFNPTVASLLMSLESVFSALAGLVVLHQVLTGRETIGCVLMFVAIILAQLPDRRKTDA